MTARGAPSFAELFTPKLVTVLREGYRLSELKVDAVSGLTVAIVALPLSMAIAIASGVSPDRGLYAAIVGGFFVSALGGSRFQIGGPAGAYIVLVAATVAKYGIDGLVLATMLSGLILLALGFFRLGTFIKYIPYPVTVGFTSGIAVIIFASQLRDLLGLTLAHAEPGPIVAKLEALGAALPSANAAAIAIALGSVALILGLRRVRPHWPGFLIAVALAAGTAALLHLPVETIASRFGGIPSGLPMPRLPDLSIARIEAVLPAALSFALLGGIESLLSAVVADGMTGRRHRSNCELVAQGVANIGSALFGGICVTGTIARTATNVRAGAHGPVAGMLHSLFLLLFLLVAAPLAGFIPLAALAAVLAVVAWNMAEKHEFAVLLRASRGDAVVLLATFLLVVFRDLTEGILVGFGIGTLLFLHRMAQSVEVETPLIEEDRADSEDGERAPYDAALASDSDVVVYRISGAFFFGAAGTVAAALDRIGERPKAYVIDMSGVPLLDSSAAASLAGFARRAQRHGAAVLIAGARPAIRRVLRRQGMRPALRAVPHAAGGGSGRSPCREPASPGLTSDVDRLAGHRHRRFLERFRMRRVGVAGIGDVLAGRAELHRLRGLGDHRARHRGDDPHAEHAIGLGVRHHLHEAVGLVVGLGAAVGRHRELAHLDLAAFLRRLLGEADSGDLGHGVDHAGDDVVVHDAGEPGDVLGDGNAFVLGLVREHRAGDDVADRPDSGDRGLEAMIGVDLAARIGRQPRLVERQPVGVGAAADRDEHGVGLDRGGFAAGGGLERDDGLAARDGDPGHLGREAELHALLLEDLVGFLGGPRRHSRAGSDRGIRPRSPWHQAAARRCPAPSRSRRRRSPPSCRAPWAARARRSNRPPPAGRR